MIIKLYSNRKVEPSSIIMANQHENMTRVLEFNLEQVPNGYRYLVLTNSSGSNLYLITDNKVDITSAFTWNGQTYEANVVVSNIELENELVSTNVLWISNTFRLQVRRNNINAEELSKLPIPPDLQMPYDKLLQLIEDVEGKLENGEFDGKDGVGIKSIEKTGSEGLVDTYTITLTDDSTFVYSVTNGRDGIDGIDGKSAYELAVENGFKGTEQEWLDSLRYDHSDEFKQLAAQVKLDAKSAEDSATKAESAMNEANTIAQANVKAISKASTDAQNAITTSKNKAVQAVQDAQATAEEAIGTKQTESVQAVETVKTSATQEIMEQKENALTEITNEKNSATEAIETGKTNALTEIETAKDEAIEEIENTGVPLEDIEKLAIKETTQGNPTIMSDSADWRLQKLSIYGQSEQASTTGAQLFDPSLFESNDVTKNGIHFIKNSDGSISISGTSTGFSTYNLGLSELQKGTYYINGTKNIAYVYVSIKKTDSESYIENNSFTIDGTETSIVTFIQINPDFSVNDIIYPMLNLGNTAKPFEQYTGGKPSPSPDYPQEIISKEVSSIIVSNGASESQTITLTEPITLRGIPVSSGGNVTIDGKWYIGDVICDKDGVVGIERNVAHYEITGNENVAKFTDGTFFYIASLPRKSLSSDNGLCTHCKYLYIGGGNDKVGICVAQRSATCRFNLELETVEEYKAVFKQAYDEGNPFKVDYHAEPTFEPLPEEVQKQYKALKSYYPNTVIQSGAFNEVTYVADTKTWIENKLNGVTELALGIGGK